MRKYPLPILLVIVITISLFATPISAWTPTEFDHSSYSTGQISKWYIDHREQMNITGELLPAPEYSRNTYPIYFEDSDNYSTFIFSWTNQSRGTDGSISSWITTGEIGQNAFSLEFNLRPFVYTKDPDPAVYHVLYLGLCSEDSVTFTEHGSTTFEIYYGGSSSIDPWPRNFTGAYCKFYYAAGTYNALIHMRGADGESTALGDLHIQNIPVGTQWDEREYYHFLFERYINATGVIHVRAVVTNSNTSATLFNVDVVSSRNNATVTDINYFCALNELSTDSNSIYHHELKSFDSGLGLNYGGTILKVATMPLVLESEEPEENSTAPDLFPHVEPNESLALVLLIFGGIFAIATIFLLRRR
jgi:hypothetical protein